jgi:carotenoid cleavage dioxygenase-like enzyme
MSTTDADGTSLPDYVAGFADQPTEVAVEDLATTGAIPEWLEGDLLRNGPAMWRVGGRRLNHWFDGMAMLHRFSIHAGKVSYANRFLRSKDYQAAKNGSIEFAEFATDPCRSLFKRMTANFSPAYSSNANVNITKVADDFVAMTETPIQIAFNPETLDTLGVVEYEDSLTPGITTAHPHYDVTTHELINYMLKMGRNSTYTVFGIPRGSKHRQAIGTADTPRPSYMHSFALTENYIVLMEFPFVVNPLSMLLSGRPFIENYRWKPELGTTFTLFDRADGSTTRLHTDEPWFAFHHVNAYEEPGKLILDVSVYADAEIVSDLFLNSLLGPVPESSDYRPPQLPPFSLRRFTLDLQANTVQSHQLCEQPLELPRINYGSHNARAYRFAYGISVDPTEPAAFLDRLARIDVESGESIVWYEPNTYPGEPVFVSRPGASDEDDGVVLSVVLDAAAGSSFLLVLDARDLSEIARATVPQAVPFGFHGQFIRSD